MSSLRFYRKDQVEARRTASSTQHSTLSQPTHLEKMLTSIRSLILSVAPPILFLLVEAGFVPVVIV